MSLFKFAAYTCDVNFTQRVNVLTKLSALESHEEFVVVEVDMNTEKCYLTRVRVSNGSS